MFCSDPLATSEVYHVDRMSPVAVRLPILSLPFQGNFSYVTSLRVGDDQLWSEWSDFGDPLLTALPEIWSRDGVVVASPPVKCKAKLDWAQLCCSLGPVPVECVISIVSDDGERLVAMTGCCAQGPGKLSIGPSLRDKLEVAVNGFDPGSTYHYILYARAQLPVLGGLHEGETLSKLDFKEVARSESFRWPSRLSDEWSCIVDWSLPIPQHLSFQEELSRFVWNICQFCNWWWVDIVKRT